MKRDLQAIGTELHERKQGVINGLHTAKNGYLEAGKNLLVIKQKKLYKAEHGNITFSQWVEGELGISRATAYQMIEVYEKFGDLLAHPDYAQIDYSKAAALTPMVDDDSTLEEKEELLHMAMNNTVKGLKNNLKEMQGKPTTDTCDHPPYRQEQWCKCGICGQMWRI